VERATYAELSVNMSGVAMDYMEVAGAIAESIGFPTAENIREVIVMHLLR